MENKCLDCGNNINKRSTHCISCFQKGSRNHSWKGGIPNCVDCGQKLRSYRPKRCRICADKQIGILKRGVYVGNKNPCWTGGKPNCVDCGTQLKYYNVKRCQKCSFKYNVGKNNSNYGNRGIKNPLYGLKKPEMSQRIKGKGNPNWKGGVSFLPYSPDWTPSLKLTIRKRDIFICQNCNINEEDHVKKHGRALTVHHIDYDKQNCKENNLITLCMKCNSEANGRRDFWFAYYTYLMENTTLKGAK